MEAPLVLEWQWQPCWYLVALFSQPRPSCLTLVIPPSSDSGEGGERKLPLPLSKHLNNPESATISDRIETNSPSEH